MAARAGNFAEEVTSGLANFIGRVGQAFSGFSQSTVTVPVTRATVGNGTLLVAIGFSTVGASASNVTDTQGNTYTRDIFAFPTNTGRQAEIWRCTGFAPLSVFDPATGSGDTILVNVGTVEDRGISAIVDQFTALSPPDFTSGFTATAPYPLVNSFKLAGTVSAADAAGGIVYSVVMPDFTVNWINQPSGFTPTGPAVMPNSGSSLQAAYEIPTPVTTPAAVTADWSWGPQAHSFGTAMACYPPAPALADAAGSIDALVTAISIPVYNGPSASAPQTSLYSGGPAFPHNESSPQQPVTAGNTYSWGCYIWQSSLSDPGAQAAINWFDASHNYLSSSFGNVVQSLTPQTSLILNAVAPVGPPAAAFADVTSLDMTGAGTVPPSPSHSFFAAAMLPAASNWIAVPSNVVWGSVTGAIVATLAPWWPNYGPQNDVAACLDGFSVVQELIQ